MKEVGKKGCTLKTLAEIHVEIGEGKDVDDSES
jgi:hypothetical protein